MLSVCTALSIQGWALSKTSLFASLLFNGLSCSCYSSYVHQDTPQGISTFKVTPIEHHFLLFVLFDISCTSVDTLLALCQLIKMYQELWFCQLVQSVPKLLHLLGSIILQSHAASHFINEPASIYFTL